MPPLVALYALQQIDLAIEQAVKQRDALRTWIADDHAVREATSAASRESQSLKEHELKLRELEGDTESNSVVLQREEGKLYGGNVRSMKGMDAVQHEIDHAKRLQHELEDALLTEMEVVEQITKRLEQLQSSLDLARGQRERDLATWKAELASEESRLTDLRQQRGDRAASVPEALLKQYEQLRARKGGRALAPLQGTMCGACRVTLPMSAVQSARTGTQLCDNCGRLLYTGPL